MAADFATFKIDVRYNSLDYGPFSFDFEDACPSSITVSSAVIRSFIGKVDIDDDLDDYTESTSELVDTVKTAVTGSYTVNAYFNFPSTAANQGVKHSLVFEITFSNSGTHNFYGQYVWVREATT
jgi:hypothetical protein